MVIGRKNLTSPYILWGMENPAAHLTRYKQMSLSSVW